MEILYDAEQIRFDADISCGLDDDSTCFLDRKCSCDSNCSCDDDCDDGPFGTECSPDYYD